MSGGETEGAAQADPRSHSRPPASCSSGDFNPSATTVQDVAQVLLAVQRIEHLLTTSPPKSSGGEAADELPAFIATSGGADQSDLPRTFLTAVATSCRKQTQVKKADTPVVPMPTRLNKSTRLAVKSLMGCQAFELHQLEFVMQMLVDELYDNLGELVFAYLDKECQMHISPENALRTIQELGLRYASKSWAASLRAKAKDVFEIEELVPKHISELLVVISHARAKIMGLETASLPALTEALPPDVVLAAAAVKGLELDTAVYQFDDSDLTEEMIREGAIAELASLEKYKVYKGDFCTWAEVQVEAQNAPDGEDWDVVDSKFFPKAKIKNGKLIAKGRLTARGFNDEGAGDFRNDSPTLSKVAFFIMLTWICSMLWHMGKVDVSGAFLQGEEMDRVVWLEFPKNLIKMGLIDAERRFRRICKAIYGLNMAPRQWYDRLCHILEGLGMVKSLIDPCLFFLFEDNMLVFVVGFHVDDLLFGGKMEKIVWLLVEFEKQVTVGQFELTFEWKPGTLAHQLPVSTSGGPAKADCQKFVFSFTGKDLEVLVKDGNVFEIDLQQTAYIEAKLKPAVEMAEKLMFKGLVAQPLDAKGCDAYRKLQGQQAWVSNTRLDISHPVSEGAGASHAPTIGDWKRLLKTAKGVVNSSKRAIRIRRLNVLKAALLLFTDGSWANEGNRTKGGHAVLITDEDELLDLDNLTRKEKKFMANIALWLCSGLKRVCTSTFDSETLSLLRGVDDIILVGMLLNEFKKGPVPSLVMKALLQGTSLRRTPDTKLPLSICWSDAGSVIETLHTSRWQVRNKRRRVDIASIKETIEEDGLDVRHCLSHEMLVDGLTKDPAGDLASGVGGLLGGLLDMMQGSVRLPRLQSGERLVKSTQEKED